MASGGGSGWSGITGAKDLSQVNVGELTEIAANKALKSQKPRAIEPGRYTTIIEPRPMARLLSTMMGAFKANTYAAFFAATGVILSAGYALWLYRRVVFGTIENPALESIEDMSKREIGIMIPLIAATLFFGIYANAAIDVFSPSVSNLLDGYYAAVGLPESIVIAAGEGASASASAH